MSELSRYRRIISSNKDNPEGPNWCVFRAYEPTALEMLRRYFSEPDEMNFVLFSTSGIHGSYLSVEAVASNMKNRPHDEHCVTFLLVQPRIISLTYGNCVVHHQEDIAFLEQLRRKSWMAMSRIGAQP